MRLVGWTVERIISVISIDESGNPLKVKLSDSLAGSGCRSVYQQLCPNPDHSTKKFYYSDSRFSRFKVAMRILYGKSLLLITHIIRFQFQS